MAFSWGYNYQKPELRRDWGHPDRDFSRLATSYYHRRGPAGVVLEKFNWFKDQGNHYTSDARLPTSLAGLGAASLGPLSLPLPQLVGLWSEPPWAVVGMGPGTLASYARPFQHLHFFEKDPRMVRFSFPPVGKPPFFHFGADAQARGVAVRLFEGNERGNLIAKAPQRFYHVLFVEMSERDWRETIKVSLLTKEGMALCFDKLTEEGLLCIHTSHLYVNAIPAIADVAHSLGFTCWVGRDMAPDDDYSRYTSEWVVVGRKRKFLDSLVTNPKDYEKAMNKKLGQFASLFWTSPVPTGKYVWTDQHHALAGLFRSDPEVWLLRHSFETIAIRLVRLTNPSATRHVYDFSHHLFRPLDQAMVRLRNRGQ